MKDKIEAKIEAHVRSFLKKDAIDYADYQILAAELTRIAQKEQAEKWEAEKEKRSEEMIKTLSSIWK